MKWKQLAWAFIAFLTFVVIALPTVWGTIQENNRLKRNLQQRQARIAELNEQIAGSEARLQSEVDRRTTELASAQSELRKLEANVDMLTARRSFECEMQAKLNATLSRISELERAAMDATDEQEVELRAQIAILQTRHDQTEARLDELKASEASEWRELEDAVRHSWNQLSDVLPPHGYDVVAQVERPR